MKQAYWFTTIFSFMLLLFLGCVTQTKLVDYKPKSVDEEAVLNCMAKMCTAMEARDVEKVMFYFHDNAEIRTVVGEGQRNSPLVSKQEFEEYLKDGEFDKLDMNPMTGIKVGDNGITVTGDRANIVGVNTDHNVPIRFYWELVKEKDNWLIVKSDWSW